MKMLLFFLEIKMGEIGQLEDEATKRKQRLAALKRKLQVSGVVVVYHVTIVAFGHGLLKKFWSFLVIGCVLCTAGSSFI